MYTRDYILRLIERFGQALIALRNRILKRQEAGEVQRAELREVAAQAGLDLDVARRLDPGMLLMWLAPTGEVDPARFWLMAELLYLEGLIGTSEGAEEEGRADLARALALLERVPQEWKPSDDFPTAAERAAEIRERLGKA